MWKLPGAEIRSCKFERHEAAETLVEGAEFPWAELEDGGIGGYERLAGGSPVSHNEWKRRIANTELGVIRDGGKGVCCSASETNKLGMII